MDSCRKCFLLKKTSSTFFPDHNFRQTKFHKQYSQAVPTNVWVDTIIFVKVKGKACLVVWETLGLADMFGTFPSTCTWMCDQPARDSKTWVPGNKMQSCSFSEPEPPLHLHPNLPLPDCLSSGQAVPNQSTGWFILCILVNELREWELAFGWLTSILACLSSLAEGWRSLNDWLCSSSFDSFRLCFLHKRTCHWAFYLVLSPVC